MRVEVLLFAGAKLAFGEAVLDVSLPDGATADSLLQQLSAVNPVFERIAAVTQMAVNEEYVPKAHLLYDGDTVAIIPPVSGGSDRPISVADAGRDHSSRDRAHRRNRDVKGGVRGYHEDDAEGKLMVPMAQLLQDDRVIDDLVAYIRSLDPQ
jgi:molybdopterin converting factor subunit 1|tara:strand:+ start:256 stop:711 length:456 start_codon:yes stop_codon:yes gene_type:complete